MRHITFTVHDGTVLKNKWELSKIYNSMKHGVNFLRQFKLFTGVTYIYNTAIKKTTHYRYHLFYSPTNAQAIVLKNNIKINHTLT